MKAIRVRIAPSPTGIPHIGNSRTALFNYLFARHSAGRFIVRIEDTDQARLVPGSTEKILQIMDWLGLDYDEGPQKDGDFGPYQQSDRKAIYQKYAQELVDQKRAVEEDGAIRFLPKIEGESKWVDLIHGEIKFENSLLEPFVILKSDGFPTYHLANVIDDHLMEISHVLRGDEWISSTPKHLQLYDAFGWEKPQFGHLPLILGEDKAKLSKRHGAASVLEFRDQGYLREAVINFMAFLGWNPKSEQEIFSLPELIAQFDLKDINRNNPIFDLKKLDWFNGKYIRELPEDELIKRLTPFLPAEYDLEIVKKALPLVKDRLVKLTDFVTQTEFLFKDKVEIDTKLVDNNNTFQDVTRQFAEFLGNDSNWNSISFEKKGRELAESLGIRAGEVFMILRIALTGSKVTPPLFESMEILGKDKTLSRLKEAAN